MKRKCERNSGIEFLRIIALMGVALPVNYFVNFVMIYMVGAYLRINEIKLRKGTATTLISVLLFILYVVYRIYALCTGWIIHRISFIFDKIDIFLK